MPSFGLRGRTGLVANLERPNVGVLVEIESRGCPVPRRRFAKSGRQNTHPPRCPASHCGRESSQNLRYCHLERGRGTLIRGPSKPVLGSLGWQSAPESKDPAFAGSADDARGSSADETVKDKNAPFAPLSQQSIEQFSSHPLQSAKGGAPHSVCGIYLRVVTERWATRRRSRHC